ncbi:MAG: hypothetical protein PHP85_04430 [Gallionella sp.]|nr:hypothetical protein [Gallionella sp.]
MKFNHWLLPALLALPCTAFSATHSGQASENALQSGSHASASAAHSIAASGQVTSAASAIPLSIGGVVSGTAGAVSGQAAHVSAHSATGPTPLDITDETITVMPPDEALKKPAAKQADKAAQSR